MAVLAGIANTTPQPSEQREPTTAVAPEAATFAAELAKKVQHTSPRASARSATEVPMTRTQLSGGEAARALSHAWQKKFHEKPSPETLSILVAQWSHETGGGRSMMNNNFGGIKGVGPSGLTSAWKTREGFGDGERHIVDNFRAYKTPEEGAGDYINFLQSRFGGALKSARAGNTAGFVHELKRAGYFTDSEQNYLRGIERHVSRAMNEGFDAVGSPKTDASAANANKPAHAAPVNAASLTSNNVPHFDGFAAAYLPATLPTEVLSTTSLEAVAFVHQLDMATVRSIRTTYEPTFDSNGTPKKPTAI